MTLVVDSCGYTVSNCLKGLVMSPAIATVSQDSWATAEDVLQEASSRVLRAGSCFTPPPDMDVYWSG